MCDSENSARLTGGRLFIALTEIVKMGYIIIKKMTQFEKSAFILI